MNNWIVRLLIVAPFMTWMIVAIIQANSHGPVDMSIAAAIFCGMIYWVIRPLLREVKS